MGLFKLFRVDDCQGLHQGNYRIHETEIKVQNPHHRLQNTDLFTIKLHLSSLIYDGSPILEYLQRRSFVEEMFSIKIPRDRAQ